MKTLNILALLIVFSAFGQIKEIETTEPLLIGEIKDISGKYVTMERIGEDLISVRYKDMKFSTIDSYKTFEFRDIDGALEYLYNTIRENLEAKFKGEKTLELPDYILTLNFKKQLGIATVNILVFHKTSGVYGSMVWMDKNRLAGLFGKKEKKKK